MYIQLTVCILHHFSTTITAIIFFFLWAWNSPTQSACKAAIFGKSMLENHQHCLLVHAWTSPTQSASKAAIFGKYTKHTEQQRLEKQPSLEHIKAEGLLEKQPSWALLCAWKSPSQSACPCLTITQTVCLKSSHLNEAAVLQEGLCFLMHLRSLSASETFELPGPPSCSCRCLPKPKAGQNGSAVTNVGWTWCQNWRVGFHLLL